MSVIRGKLNLKNSAAFGPDRARKIEKQSDKPSESKETLQTETQKEKIAEPAVVKELTPAQIEVLKRRKEKLIEKIKKDSQITYREKKKKFNNFLEGLPTLFEMPKTGSG